MKVWAVTFTVNCGEYWQGLLIAQDAEPKIISNSANIDDDSITVKEWDGKPFSRGLSST